MIQRIVSRFLVILCVGLVYSLFFTSNALADKYQDIEDEANTRAEKNLSTGWINIISPDSIIIDDTSYTVTRKTQFLKRKRAFKEGVFVEFESGDKNLIVTIDIAEPQEKDMDMKPIDRTKSKPVNNKVDSQKDAPHLEDGVWVN